MKAFTPRLAMPEPGNPYYNTISNGGYSGAIVGKPTDAGCNVYSNCVGHAAGRFNEIIGKDKFVYFKVPPNAEDFIEQAIREGLKTGTEPRLGAIICWAKGKPGNSADGAGHVAVVEQIADDGTITTSESEWNGRAFVTRTYKKPYIYGSAYTFLGFIYQPEEPGEDMPDEVLKRGMSGEDIKWLQHKLCVHGYLRCNEIDGDFGTITFGAVLAFQSDKGLDVDGIAGPATKAALLK